MFSEQLGCRAAIAKPAVKRSKLLNTSHDHDDDTDAIWFYGIGLDGCTVFMESSQQYFSSHTKTSVLPVNDLFAIFFSRDEDIIVISRSGKIFALSSENLQIIDTLNLGLKPSSESVVEASMDNTQTQLFALTTKSRIAHAIVQKVESNSAATDAQSIKVFIGSAIHRFKIDGSIFTFRVQAIPAKLQTAMFAKREASGIGAEEVRQAMSTFTPTLSSTKFLIFTLLHKEDV